jgi:hypothetical protein
VLEVSITHPADGAARGAERSRFRPLSALWSRHRRFARRTRRGLDRLRLRQALGALWLLDAALQAQPAMLHPAWWRVDFAQVVMAEPGWVTAPVWWVVRLVTSHPVAFDLAFAALQAGIGIALVANRFPRLALSISVPWSLAIWWLGEGLGQLPTGYALFGATAPGPVLIYALLVPLAWPKEHTRSAGAMPSLCLGTAGPSPASPRPGPAGPSPASPASPGTVANAEQRVHQHSPEQPPEGGIGRGDVAPNVNDGLPGTGTPTQGAWQRPPASARVAFGSPLSETADAASATRSAVEPAGGLAREPLDLALASALWVLLWVGGALMALSWHLPPGAVVSANLIEAADGQPSWLAAIARHVAHALAGMPSWSAGVLAAFEVAVGIGACSRRLQPLAVGAGMVAMAVAWLVAEQLGGVATTGSTDPGLAPLVVLLGAALLAAGRGRPSFSPHEART